MAVVAAVGLVFRFWSKSKTVSDLHFKLLNIEGGCGPTAVYNMMQLQRYISEGKLMDNSRIKVRLTIARSKTPAMQKEIKNISKGIKFNPRKGTRLSAVRRYLGDIYGVCPITYSYKTIKRKVQQGVPMIVSSNCHMFLVIKYNGLYHRLDQEWLGECRPSSNVDKILRYRGTQSYYKGIYLRPKS